MDEENKKTTKLETDLINTWEKIDFSELWKDEETESSNKILNVIIIILNIIILVLLIVNK